MEMVVRLGDCYALIVNHFYNANDLRQAYTIVQQMQQHGVTLRPYLESNVIADVYRAVGKEPPQEITADDEDSGENEIEEEELPLNEGEEADAMTSADEKLDSARFGSSYHRRAGEQRYSSNGDYKSHRK